MPYDAPLSRAINGKNWWWYHPVADYIVGIFDGISALVAVASRRPGIKRSEIPKPTVRPWDKEKTAEVLKVKPSTLERMRERLGW